VLTQGVAVRCGSANAFLFELAKHYWTVTPDDRDSEDVRHLLSSAGERDKRRFDRALGGFVDGRPLMRPRGLGKVWAGNEPEVVSRRKDFGPDAFSALVFRHDGAASASRADPAVPPGWSVAPPVARDELADVLAPQPPGSAARVTIVFDQDWQVTSGMGHDEFGRAAAVHAGLEEVAVGPGVGQLQAYRHSDDDLVYVVPAEDLDVVVESLLRAVAAKWPSPAPPARRAAPAEEPRDVLRVLVLATEWHSRKGGISSFNRGLCKALARAGAQVECLVGPDEDASIDDSNPVRLTRVGTVDGRTEEGAVIQALSTHRAMLGDPDIVIGHGHITGGAARELAVAHYPHALRVHIVHTRPVPLAAAKATEDSTTVLSRGEAKLERERKNARTAQLVCGVGPKLFAEAEELVRAAVPAPLVINLMPGLDAEIPQVESWPPRRSNVYTVGRVTDEAKGTEVLIKAIKALQTDGRRVALWIRGVPPAEADEAQALLGRRIHDVFIRPYSADTKQLHEDLWNTTVMCMPSREEGFGLVALEAIAAGIPVLVDRYSGLAEVLEEIDRGDPAIVDAPPSEAQAARVWRDKIVAVLDDPLTHRARALRRRADLAARCDWDASAAQLLDAIKRVRVRVV
jgi:glycosyltransferase involved in cell wall biosynthesis